MLTPYRPFGYEAFTPFPIEHTHYQAILAQCEQNLVDEVASMVGDKDKVFSKALVNQLIEWEISFQLTSKGLHSGVQMRKLLACLTFLNRGKHCYRTLNTQRITESCVFSLK